MRSEAPTSAVGSRAAGVNLGGQGPGAGAGQGKGSPGKGFCGVFGRRAMNLPGVGGPPMPRLPGVCQPSPIGLPPALCQRPRMA